MKFQKLKRYAKSIVDEECGPSGNILVFLVVLGIKRNGGAKLFHNTSCCGWQ